MIWKIIYWVVLIKFYGNVWIKDMYVYHTKQSPQMHSSLSFLHSKNIMPTYGWC